MKAYSIKHVIPMVPTPIANCNLDLLVGDSPQAVGFSPVGHLPVGRSPVGRSPVG